MRLRKFSIRVLPLILLTVFLSVSIVSAQSNSWLTVTSPNDITILRGESNRAIIWSVDSNLEIHWRILQNGTEISRRSGYCTSAIISVDLYDLDIGTYIFKLEVWTDNDPQYGAGVTMVYGAIDIVVVNVKPSRNFWLDVGFVGSIIGMLIVFKIVRSGNSKS